MSSSNLPETLVTQKKISSYPISRNQNMDLELRTIDEFNKHAPGLWLLPRKSEHCCIYRVPDSIRGVNPEEYTPQVLIIGPLHHSLKFQALVTRRDITSTKSIGYLNMEQHKKFYLAEFTQRFKGKHTIDGLRRIIEQDEEMIRASYSESTVWIESPEFIDMILHDSVFIIEFFLRVNFGILERTEDPLMVEPCLMSTVNEDLKLLENQLPYFILEKLFHSIFGYEICKFGITFRKLVITHFACQGEREIPEFKHFTDLLRRVYVVTLPKLDPGAYKPIEHMYTADKLHSGGVKFEGVEEKFSLNVIFENGCLKIPYLLVEDKVEMRLRNVMALEQCHFPNEAHVCNYVIFLDHLIDTHKDVELLAEKGIIKNWIGQDSLVAEMVNKLCWGIIDNGSYYSDIAGKLNDFSKNWMNRSIAHLKEVYFPNPWKGTATVAAMILLIMTLIQTVASIMQVKQ